MPIRATKMERERWAQVKQILGAYLDLEADERAGYLAQCCEGNAELLADVQRPINSHDGLGDFLETPLFGGEPEELLTGRQIGSYLLGEPIAEGGIGTVYRAVRLSDFERQVAVKLLPQCVEHLGTSRRDGA